MRIFRATNTAALEYIKDKIRPADGVSKEQYLENLAAWLLNVPQTLFLQVAFEGEKLMGFMVAYLPPEVNFVFISQVWAENKRLAVEMLVRLSSWADQCSRTQLRMESESDHDGYSTFWGLETITETKAISFEQLRFTSLLELADERDKPTTHEGLSEESHFTPKEENEK